MIDMQEVLFEVEKERARQDKLWGSQRDFTTHQWLAILMEEVGEVARAALSHDRDNWYEELIQVAAVAVQMAEHLDDTVWP
jgi:NTP pyrophosphatase (non-canonical NTP hydrolase)